VKRRLTAAAEVAAAIAAVAVLAVWRAAPAGRHRAKPRHSRTDDTVPAAPADA
jgi:hypothetical protein